jgi:hypothetical protein
MGLWFVYPVNEGVLGCMYMSNTDAARRAIWHSLLIAVRKESLFFLQPVTSDMDRPGIRPGPVIYLDWSFENNVDWRVLARVLAVNARGNVEVSVYSTVHSSWNFGNIISDLVFLVYKYRKALVDFPEFFPCEISRKGFVAAYKTLRGVTADNCFYIHTYFHLTIIMLVLGFICEMSDVSI